MIMRPVNTASAVARLTLAAVYDWPSRPIDTTVTVLGFATVAGIFAAILAMAAGYRHIFDAAGDDATAIILAQGSDSEWASAVPVGVVAVATQSPGVARINGIPLIAPNLLGTLSVQYSRRNLAARITLRGVSPAIFSMDHDLRIVRGRWFRPGLNELVVGASAERNFRHLEPGDRVFTEGRAWTIVGVFSAGSQFFSSEAWTSLGSMQGAERRRTAYSSLYVGLTAASAFPDFSSQLSQNPQFALTVMRATAYYARQASGLSRLITRLGSFFTVMMAAAAIFGAMSTLLVMLEERRFQIAMLRAFGYPHGIVFSAVLLEGSILGCIGGMLGVVVVHFSLNGYAASTLGLGPHMDISNSTPQVFFHFLVTPPIMAQAVLCAILMGLLGGLYPALRASRMPIASALRDV
jgi:putative ABC transport system permease protein